jgi:putative transposase
MPQSLANVVLHITFSTKHRFPFLSDRSVRLEMHAYIGGTCNGLGGQVLTVGGGSDHVHIECVLSRKICIAELVGEVKRASSKWVKTKGRILSKFSWQIGYAAYSVGQYDIERVRHYIETQEEHHRRRSFQDEYRASLKENGVEFDERFVWD